MSKIATFVVGTTDTTSEYLWDALLPVRKQADEMAARGRASAVAKESRRVGAHDERRKNVFRGR